MTCYSPSTRPPQATDAPLDVHVDPARRLLRPVGDLDEATCPLLLDAVETLSEARPGEIRISLAGIRFLGAAGINALVRVADTQRANSHPMRVEDVPDRVARIIVLGNAGWLLA